MRYVVVLATVLALASCDSGSHSGHDHGVHQKSIESAKGLPGADKVKDPVCGMSIAKGALKAEFDKADWYFCSDSCREKFTKEPAKYAKACACATTMKNCLCSHCEGKRDPCDCAEHK